MKPSITIVRLAAWLAVLVLLHGCAAATVIRKQPDFNEENNRQLQQLFPSGKVARVERHEAVRYTSGWQGSQRV